MSFEQSRLLDATGRAGVLAVVCALLQCGPFLGRAAAGDWVELVDETASRLVADASVGISDQEEKDLAAGDVDKDGDTDMIVVRKQPFTNPGGKRNVLFMNEDGVMVDRTLTLAPDFGNLTNDRDVELADVDGDTWLDVITAGTFEQQPRILMNLGNDGGGNWLGFQYDPSRIPTLESTAGVGPFFCGLGVGDIDNDNDVDLYFTDYGGLLTSEATDLDDVLLLNDGTGHFTDVTALRLDPGMSESLFGVDADIVDVNGDGWNDIVKDNATGFFGGQSGKSGEAAQGRSAQGEGSVPSPSVGILYNDGAGNPGHFSFADIIYTQAPYMVAPADFTQDTRLDLFVVDDNQDRYLINTGNDAQNHAEFTTATVGFSPGTAGLGGNIEFADLDGDGILDILVSDVDTDIPNCGDSQLVLLQGQGVPPAITYRDPLQGATRPWSLSAFDAEPIDVNGDGALDLWVGGCDGNRIFVSTLIFRDGFESGDTSRWDLASE